MPLHIYRRLVLGTLCLGILSGSSALGQTLQEATEKPTITAPAVTLLGQRVDPAPLRFVKWDNGGEYKRATPPSTRLQLNSRSPSTFPGARRLTAGLALGLVGFFGGGLAGAAIEGRGCHCDDPGMRGFVIGAPIGAGAGFAIGMLLAR